MRKRLAPLLFRALSPWRGEGEDVRRFAAASLAQRPAAHPLEHADARKVAAALAGDLHAADSPRCQLARRRWPLRDSGQERMRQFITGPTHVGDSCARRQRCNARRLRAMGSLPRQNGPGGAIGAAMARGVPHGRAARLARSRPA